MSYYATIVIDKGMRDVIMLSNASEIGKFLKEYRKRNNDMSLRNFSKLTGISFSHLSKIERGEHNPSKTTLDIISEAIDVDKDELYIMAGYAPEQRGGIDLDAFFPIIDEGESEKIDIMKRISEEFPDADLMFHDLGSLTAEQLQEVYDFIKFKKSQNDN